METEKTGVELIADERLRHFALGFDAGHDDGETMQELAVAAACYAADGTYAETELAHAWPWTGDTSYPDKRGKLDRIRQLTISGALIAAEIDRLQRENDKEGEVASV